MIVTAEVLSPAEVIDEFKLVVIKEINTSLREYEENVVLIAKDDEIYYWQLKVKLD